jgi:uncharacterized protein
MTLLLLHARGQTKCPECGKHTLRVVSKQSVRLSSSVTRVTTILHCDNCHSEHTRTENHNNHNGGGGIFMMPMGGFGGGRGGFGGGGFGGGSFGGGGSGSGW